MPYNCTVAYHGGDVWYGQIRDQEVGQQVHLVTSHAIIGPEGIALVVENNPFLERWYEVPNACPQITVRDGEGFASKDLGSMIKRASETEWVGTDNALIKVSTEGTLVKILFGTAVVGQTTHLQIETKETKIMSQKIEHRVSELKN